MSAPEQGRMLRVLVDASALSDGRANAGIGRYTDRLIAHLDGLPGLAATVSRPRISPLSESRPGRILHGSPALLLTASRCNPRIIHACGGEPVLGWPLGRQVVTVHDVVPWAEPPARRGMLLRAYLSVQRQRIQRCAAVIAVSAEVAADARRVLGVSRERVHIVPEGVDPPFSAEPLPGDADRRAAAGVAAGPYLLWVGSLRAHDPRKALDLLLDAFTTVVRGAGEPSPLLVLAGERGPEADRLARRATGERLPVHFAGRVDDVTLAALYRGAAAAVIPSLHEGFGLPLLEAMACGAPTVATVAGNLPELSGGAALLVPRGDAAALAAGMETMLTEPARAARSAEAGRRRAAEHTWQRTAELTARVYRLAAGLPA